MEKTIRKYVAIFTFPTLIAFFVAFVIPFLMGLYLSFCKFTTVTNAKFIGLENYIKALTSEDFHNALFFTVKFALVAVLSINVLAFILAVLLT